MDWAVAVRENAVIQMEAKSKLSRARFDRSPNGYNFDEDIR